ncbi:cobalt-precorrin 5A hydrolase [Spirochaeta cellobiosiphila]|uniref:cobalt-precorrin 5A hydrolase n=1 Tax=Spirochaeta cellobiosiphila TaxID=504483 RepID=UPI00041B5A04|nr:cobalamin biosynthesis protein [Spirochaeta cellobiosiphila]
MKIGVITITKSAYTTGLLLQQTMENCVHHHSLEKGWLKAHMEFFFTQYEGLIFVMATGIVVRMIAPYIQSKYSDPAVVVVDDAQRYAISLLSGHEGGANGLASQVATILDAEAVITTASDTNRFRTIGIGCRKGTPAAQIKEAVEQTLDAHNIPLSSLRLGGSFEVKKIEAGLLGYFHELAIPLKFYTKEEINHCPGEFQDNPVSLRQLGVRAVAEPCALLASRRGHLVLSKQIYKDVTIAVAEEEEEIRDKT